MAQEQKLGRFAEQVQKEISLLLIKGLKDPRIGFVTLTGVEVSPDKRIAKVYYTVMGDDQARIDTSAGLKSSTSFLRRELGKKLRVRHVPELNFFYDSSIEYGNRIESILQELNIEPEDESCNRDSEED